MSILLFSLTYLQKKIFKPQSFLLNQPKNTNTSTFQQTYQAFTIGSNKHLLFLTSFALTMIAQHINDIMVFKNQENNNNKTTLSFVLLSLYLILDMILFFALLSISQYRNIVMQNNQIPKKALIKAIAIEIPLILIFAIPFYFLRTVVMKHIYLFIQYSYLTPIMFIFVLLKTQNHTKLQLPYSRLSYLNIQNILYLSKYFIIFLAYFVLEIFPKNPQDMYESSSKNLILFASTVYFFRFMLYWGPLAFEFTVIKQMYDNQEIFLKSPLKSITFPYFERMTSLDNHSVQEFYWMQNQKVNFQLKKLSENTTELKHVQTIFTDFDEKVLKHVQTDEFIFVITIKYKKRKELFVKVFSKKCYQKQQYTFLFKFCLDSNFDEQVVFNKYQTNLYIDTDNNQIVYYKLQDDSINIYDIFARKFIQRIEIDTKQIDQGIENFRNKNKKLNNLQYFKQLIDFKICEGNILQIVLGLRIQSNNSLVSVFHLQKSLQNEHLTPKYLNQLKQLQKQKQQQYQQLHQSITVLNQEQETDQTLSEIVQFNINNELQTTEIGKTGLLIYERNQKRNTYLDLQNGQIVNNFIIRDWSELDYFSLQQHRYVSFSANTPEHLKKHNIYFFEYTEFYHKSQKTGTHILMVCQNDKVICKLERPVQDKLNVPNFIVAADNESPEYLYVTYNQQFERNNQEEQGKEIEKQWFINLKQYLYPQEKLVFTNEKNKQIHNVLEN